MITLANIRRAIYNICKRLDIFESKVQFLENLVSDDVNPTAAIDKYNEVINFLDQVENTLKLKTLLESKQDNISAGSGIDISNNEVSIDLTVALKTDLANEKQGNGIGVCSTSSGTALTVAITNYELVTNGTVSITFEHDVPANATLNINNKGAKPIYYKGAAITADIIKANDIVIIAYDGINYIVTSIQTEKVPAVIIEQSTGNSETAVMSQKAITDMMNALTRHTRKTDFDLNVLKQAVADANLEKYGLKVGDEKTIGNYRYIIAGLNPFFSNDTPYSIETNHVGIIVITNQSVVWNPSSTASGSDNRGAGYKNSDLHYFLCNTVLPTVKTHLGANNILSHTKVLTNNVNINSTKNRINQNGASEGYTFVENCEISALSEIQVYGSIIYSSSGFDSGEACSQLDVFRIYNPQEILQTHLWLRDVVSFEQAAVCAKNFKSFCANVQNLFNVVGLVLFH